MFVLRPLFQCFPHLKRRARSGLQDEAGGIAIMMAIVAVPLISAVGVAVDLSRAYRAASITQNALDSAALAAGRAAQTNGTKARSAAEAAATSYYNAVKPTDVVSSTITLATDSTSNNFTLTATSWITTPFFGILSRMYRGAGPEDAPAGCTKAFQCLKITRSATASIAQGGNGGSNIEVSLMLDVTDSMVGTRITTLKRAATDLVDTVIWADQSRSTSRVAIVPFAQGVNVGPYYTAVTGQSTRRGYRTIAPCVTDRLGVDADKDTAPGSYSQIPAYFDVTSIATCNPSAAIAPLSSDKAALKQAISALSAGGFTAGALGTQWAWYTLSPDWASIWGTASAPGPYSDLTTLNSSGAPRAKKIAVLMTDGDYNWMSGILTINDKVNRAALSLCTGMKSAGITIYTVGFQLRSATARNVLTSCASSTDKFCDASSEPALLAAFKDISLKISSLRLTN